MKVLTGLTLAATLAAAAPAPASVTIRSTCDPAGPSFVLTVDVFNQWVEGEVTGYEIVLEESWVGACEPAALLATSPMPLPAFTAEAQYVVTVPAPALAQEFLFTPRLKQPDGTIVAIPLRYGDALAVGVAECFPGPAVRGYLRTGTWPGYAIEACSADCGSWLCYDHIDLSGVDPAAWQPYLDTAFAVDVYGTFNLAPMPGDVCLSATSVVARPSNDCGVVLDETGSWSGLKATYR